MTRSSLNPGQHQTVEIIEALGFGVIEVLLILGGSPSYEPEPRIIQEIKLGSEAERQPDGGCTDSTLKKEFEGLFRQLSRLGDATVDIEVRHSLPFKLVLERPLEALL